MLKSRPREFDQFVNLKKSLTHQEKYSESIQFKERDEV